MKGRNGGKGSRGLDLGILELAAELFRSLIRSQPLKIQDYKRSLNYDRYLVAKGIAN